MSGITIAIPTYNRGAILVETIARLLALDPRADEIVIVDQTAAHPREIAAMLETWSRDASIRYERLEKPSVPAAMNHALRIAGQPIVLFLDDDLIPDRSLAGEHLRAHGHDIWAVVGQVLQPGEEPGHFEEGRLHRGAVRDLDFPFRHDVAMDVENVMAGNLSVVRDRALSIGGFDERFVHAAYRFESDFARRVIAAGGRIRFEPRAQIRHLKLPTGGVRSHGDPRRTAAPTHSAGDYLFAMKHVPAFWRYAARRFRQNVFTRYTLAHPVAIPMKAVAEIRGLLLARRLARESFAP
jgi:GT2 family glycosyltransferase